MMYPMNQNRLIYLSVDLPNKGKLSEDEHIEKIAAVNSAVIAFVHVFLGRGKLIFDGHPAVLAQIEFMANDFDIDFSSWVEVYQFGKESIVKARETVFDENEFTHAVFIGGGKKSVDEFKHFRSMQPTATIIPITSTDGATIEIAKLAGLDPDDYRRKDNFIKLYHENLEIPFSARRFKSMQELEVANRLFNNEVDNSISSARNKSTVKPESFQGISASP